MTKLTPLLICAVLASGCKTTPATPAAPETGQGTPVAPTWLNAAGAASFRPVLTVDGRPYLHVANALHSFKWSEPESLQDLSFPSCFDDEEVECPKVQPASDAAVAKVGPAPQAGSVYLVTHTGLCAPKLGTLVTINTTGCDPSVALAYPMTGCDGAYAPLALTGVANGADLRWRAAVDGPKEHYAAGATLADPGHNAAVATWFKASVPVAPGVPLEARALLVTATTEHESVQARMAAAHLHRPQCEDEIFELDAVGIQAGDSWHPVPDVGHLAGVISSGGHAVALVTNDTIHFGVHLRAEGYAFNDGGSFEYYRDNEECYDTGKIGYEQDCAP